MCVTFLSCERISTGWLPVGGHQRKMRSSNGGWHGLAGWGFRGFPETGAGLWADDGTDFVSDARSPLAVTNLCLAELRSVSEFSGAEGLSLVLAGKAGRPASLGDRRTLQADQARRTARRRRRVPAALIDRVGKGALSPPRFLRWWARFRLRSLSYRGQVAQPTLRSAICANVFPATGKRENVNGQAEADLAGRGQGRRTEKIATAQTHRQIHGAKGDQSQGAWRAGCKTRSPEAAHRHQSLPRRGFQGRRLANLRAVSRSRHCGRDRRPGARPCDPPDRALQSGGSLKTALPRRRIPDGLCPEGLGQNLHRRAGRDPDERGFQLDPAAAGQASDHGLFG